MSLLADLQVLDISFNNITELPDFSSLIKLTHINCANNYIEFFEEAHFVYENTTLVDVILDKNPLSITSIIIPTTQLALKMEGTHIETLTIKCQIPNACVINTLKLESNMTETPIINEIKQSLSMYGLVGVGSGIPPDGLRSDAFTDLADIANIRINKHRFDLYEAFQQLGSYEAMVYASFKEMEITDESELFQPTGILAMTNLKSASLGNNNLTVIPDLRGLQLVSFMIQQNQITFIHRHILIGMRSLEEISLLNNPIMNLGDFPYQALPNLGKLYIGYVLHNERYQISYC